MAVRQETQPNSGPDLKALGLNSAKEIFDLLSLLKIDGEPVIKDDRMLLDPKQKAQAVMEYFYKNFKVNPNDLPYLASLVKHDLKHGKIGWRKR
jgi:hypothetical protein